MNEYEEKVVLEAINWLKNPAVLDDFKIQKAINILLKISEMGKEFYKYNEYYGENDGYGIVGYSFDCMHCNKSNRFVDNEKNEQTCEYCGEINSMIVYE